MTLNSSELEEDQEEILKAFLHEYFEEGFIPTQNLVKMRTLPIDSSRTSKNPKVQQALAEYEAINNKWRDGYAMPILFEVSVKSFGWVLKRFLKSTLKKHSV